MFPCDCLGVGCAKCGASLYDKVDVPFAGHTYMVLLRDTTGEEPMILPPPGTVALNAIEQETIIKLARQQWRRGI